jgi:hypothetical protein
MAFGHCVPENIAHRDRTASRTYARTRRIVVGCEGRLDSGERWFVGARLPASERGRSWRLPGFTRSGMGQHSQRVVGIDCRLILARWRGAQSLYVNASTSRLHPELNRGVRYRPTNMEFCRSTVCTLEESEARKVPHLFAYRFLFQ